MFLVESVQKYRSTDIVIFSRENNVKKVETITDFKPYFYIPEDAEPVDDWRIDAYEKGYTSIYGERLKKVYTKRSKDVAGVRGMFSKHYEADILFPQRYIIDRIGEVETYPLKIGYLDIELNAETNFPDMKNPDQEVTCIAYVDSFTNKSKLFLLESLKSDKLERFKNLSIYKTESELLEGFIACIIDNDPDVVSGWNVDDFDLTYLVRRMKKLGVDPNLLSPLGLTYLKERNDGKIDVIIKGRIVIDMMDLYGHYRRITNQGKAESMSLEFTAQDILGKGKIKHKESFGEMWKQKPDKLVEYNERDNLLVKELNEKLGIVDFFNSIRTKSCAQLVNVYHTVILVDGLFLRRVKDRFVLPSKNTESGKRFEGATVIEPIPTVYEYVLVFDVKGEYPNIMKTFNTSPETFNPNGEIKIKTGIAFDKGCGLIPETVSYLEKERNLNKKLRDKATDPQEKTNYNHRQYAIKVIMNSLFGVIGYPKYRLYKKEVAESITFLGRKIIEWSKHLLEKLGYEVIYGDTDSVFVTSKKRKLFEIIKEGRFLRDKLNNSYTDFAAQYGAASHSLEMEFEKIFKSIIFVAKKGVEEGAKKRYACLPLWKEGETNFDVEYTGLEVNRSDSPRIAREIQETVINMVLRNKPKKEVVDYIKAMEKKIRNREIDDELLGFPKGITKRLNKYGTNSGIPPHISGAIYSNKYLGTRFAQGSKPKWVYISSVPLGYPDTHVVTFEDTIPKGFILDIKKTNKRIFEMKLQSIFNSVGWEFPILTPGSDHNFWGKKE